MSSPYPVLNNKPIDQWKVTELKEELKRRKLPLRGLKEDLVKRLDEALREEMPAPNKDLEQEQQQIEEEIPPVQEEMEGVEEVKEPPPVQEEMDTALTDDVAPTNETNPVSADTTKTETVVNENPVNFEKDSDIEKEDKKPVVDASTGEEKPEKLKDQAIPCDREMKEELKTDESSDQAEQVTEVRPDLGSQIKCESISTDSVPIIEKNNLKGNLNADISDLETKPEGKQDQAPLEGENNENYENTPSNVDISAEGGEGSPEKLNLDRSSGDESMEEELNESGIKQNVESDVVSSKEVETDTDERVPKTEKFDNMDEIGAGDEEKHKPAPTVEKRKLEAEEVVPNNESMKRPRRWNADSIKIPEQQTPNLINTSTPKDSTPVAIKRSFNRSDSTVSSDSPKERIVPASQKASTNSLRIDRFVRPFTLKAVQELLGKTGSVSSFWMDHIKTHCYVTYSSVEEAVATRNAVYNLQWPPNGGNLLVADFVDPQEVKVRVEAPPQPAQSISPRTGPTTNPSPKPQSNHNQQTLARQTIPVTPTANNNRQVQLPPPPPLPNPSLGNPSLVKERPPPPVVKKVEPPPPPAVVTLDDLFRKTKAMPRIYYLPLSDDEVAAKLATQGKSQKD